MNKLLLLLIAFFFTLGSFSQVSEEQKRLEEKRNQINKEIASFKTLLTTEKKKEKSVLTLIAEQKARINLSQKLINTTTKQMRLLNDDIYLKQLEINQLNKELKILKEDYAKMIVKTYKSRNDQSRIMFILSSENFLQAYKRIQYMKQYASFRKMQGEEIIEKQARLADLKVKQEASKKSKEKVLADNLKEKEAFEVQKKEQEELAKEFQKNKKKYTAEITAKQKAVKQVDAEIKKMIAEAIAKANKKNEAKTGVKSSGSSTTFDLTPEGKIVSANFKSNKGKLPWPVSKGYVYLKFGVQPHPVVKNLTVQNSGLEIATEEGASALAIFEGEVLQVQLIKGSNKKIVYIQHGDFITIYQNLDSVNVREGDKVSLRQNLGKIHTDSSGKTILKLLINQNATTLNPEQWLSNM